MISKKELRYLVVIAELGEEARLSKISERIGVKPPSALEEINHLISKGLVFRLNNLVKLTEKGKEEVKRVERAHRIIEYVFYNGGMNIERACEIASELDCLFPSDAIEALFITAGRPKKCPHGKDI